MLPVVAGPRETKRQMLIYTLVLWPVTAAPWLLGVSGPLYAVRVVTSGTGGLSAPLTSLLPVSSAAMSITLPPAQDSYTAVLPSATHLAR